MNSLSVVGKKVLLLWSSTVKQKDLVNAIESHERNVGEKGSVAVENLERVIISDHASSSFDVVFCGTLESTITSHSSEVFAEIARILKPGGTMFIRESVSRQDDVPNLRTAAKLATALKFSGFINISKPQYLTDEQTTSISLDNKSVTFIEIKASKPNFEIGASVSFSSAKKAVNKPTPDVAKIWMLSADETLDENVEFINEEDLLDEDDLQIPDSSSLKVCNTTKKRKACKNCTCGLAEELEQEVTDKISQNATVSSSCGSCYLGDAFRCASCPYLGMPAFKPGEKISLNDRQLKADS